MYSFEGAYKRDLVQSLGRKQLSKKDELLAAAQEKRQKRERFRLETESSLKIQSAYRSHRSRTIAFEKEQSRYNVMISKCKAAAPTPQQVGELFKCINFFYQTEKDVHLMVTFCAFAVKHQPIFKQYTSGSDVVNQYQTKTWLKTVSQVVAHLCGTNENISMPLRVLEIFLDSRLYNEEGTTSRLCHLYHDIIKNGYFDTLRRLSDSRIPDCEETTTNPPTPFSASVIDLILKPLKLAATQNQPFRLLVMGEFCKHFMSKSYSSQVYHYILPCIRAESQLPLTEVLSALRHNNTDSLLTGEDKPTLLHSLMSIFSPNIEGLSEDAASDYLHIITELFPHLSKAEIYKLPSVDDDDDYEMDYSVQDDNVVSLNVIKMECLMTINSPNHVAKFVALTKTDKSNSSVLKLAKLCHMMTSRLGQLVHSNRLMYSLAFNEDFLRQLWNQCLTISVLNSAGNNVTVMQVLARGLGESLYTTVEGSIHSLMALLSAFSSLFYHSILTLHDDDFRPKSVHRMQEEGVTQESSCPFSRQELVSMVATLRDACLGIVYLAIPDSKPVFDDKRQFLEELGIKTNKEKLMSKEEYMKQRSQWIYLFNVTARLTKHIYIRDTRTRFCPEGHWLSSQVRVKANELNTLYHNHIEVFDKQPLKPGLGEEEDEGVNLSVTDTRRLVVLTELPFVVPFEERVRIFHKLLDADRSNYQTGFDGYGSMAGNAINLNIRRDFLYEDAFEKLSQENEVTVKPKIRVHMRNATGLDEAGIDGGGIFREFLWELLRTGFDPNRALFRYTASDDVMFYPNPQAPSVMPDFKKHFFFLGRMLGKALYENMLVELPFAGFFLSKILGKMDSDFHQLASLDPLLYKNLLYVKNYPGDVTELGLDFSIVNENLGVTTHLELKPNGKNIVVNNHNRIEYVHLMADYKLNRQIRPQCQAFTQGLEDVLKLEWLRMFNQHELYILISGATSPIDVNDLRRHTQYSGDFTVDHPTIESFWRVVHEFTPVQRSALLKFVTSCSRPPLLGFKDLYPAFCIHYGGKEDRLPTASTCMNFLKLPDYPDEETLRARLTYAVESGAGFELS